MAHFSKFIRPGAQIVDVKSTDRDLMVAAAKNPDGTIAFVIFNEGFEIKDYELRFRGSVTSIKLGAQSLQTVIIPSTN